MEEKKYVLVEGESNEKTVESIESSGVKSNDETGEALRILLGEES